MILAANGIVFVTDFDRESAFGLIANIAANENVGDGGDKSKAARLAPDSKRVRV